MSERRVFDSPAALATAVAQHLIDAIAVAQSAGGVPAICLTGGTTAELVHREVARLGGSSPVDWTAVEFWWGDERYVDSRSPDRNAEQARRDVLEPLGVPAGRIYAMPTTGSACSVEEGAREYAARYARRAGAPFLVTMLGVGPDGHVASLFPGLPGVRAEEATAIAVTGSPKPPSQRISLTLPALNNSEAVWFLAAGAAKASAVASVAAGVDLPASQVHGLRETVWFLDRAAAGQTPG